MSMTDAQIRRLVEDEAVRIADERVRAAIRSLPRLDERDIDARLKSTRHENSDHLDRALLVSKLKPGQEGYVVGASGGDTAWVPGLESLLTTQADIITRNAGVPVRESRGIVSSLPGSPYDGQECYYQSAAMATAGVVWKFRYRATGGTYKWEFVGGPPLSSATVAAQESTTSTSYAALATAGPALALPLAGTFRVILEGEGYAAAGVVSSMSYDIGGTGAVDADRIDVYHATAAVQASVSRTKTKTFGSALTLTPKYKSSGGTAAWAERAISVIPICVG